MNERYVINIGRQYGSGGREIGMNLASKLGIAFYDKELLKIASQQSGLNEEFFEKADEKKHFSLIGGLNILKGIFTDESYSGFNLNNENLFKIQSDAIRSIADKGSCLFVGRCADYVLKDYSRCMNVFICSDSDQRVKRVAEIKNISSEDARALIEKSDKERSEYYNYFTSKSWGAAESYHLCVNTSFLGIDETVNLLLAYAGKKFNL